MSTPSLPSVSKQRVIILPGCGCSPIERSNWYTDLAASLNALPHYSVIAPEMPDPVAAHRSVWLPFIASLDPSPSTIVVGHSSGAEAAMRLAETTRLKGLVLVSACVSDLGMESERESGWYDGEWQWERIRANCGWIVQLHGTDDWMVPIAEGQAVAAALHSQLIEQNGVGHFLCRKLPFLVQLLEQKRLEESSTSATEHSSSGGSSAAS